MVMDIVMLMVVVMVMVRVREANKIPKNVFGMELVLIESRFYINPIRSYFC